MTGRAEPPVCCALFANAHNVAHGLFERDLSELELFYDAKGQERAHMLSDTYEILAATTLEFLRNDKADRPQGYQVDFQTAL
jgi:hypothetical protein